MNINAVNSFSKLAPVSSGGLSIETARSSDENFGSIIKDAVESLAGSQKAAEQGISKAVTGDSTDLHKTIISLQSADLKFQLGLQVRNKLIGAYEEVMRMQV